MVECEKMVGLYRVVAFGGGSYGPSEFLSLLLFLFLFAAFSDVVFGYEFYIDVFGQSFLSFGIGANGVLNAHSIDSFIIGGIEACCEVFQQFEGFVLVREDVVDLAANRIKGLVVVESVLSEMAAVDGQGGFGSRTKGGRLAHRLSFINSLLHFRNDRL